LEIIIAVIGLSGTIILSLIGLYGARKYNIGPNQEKLVSTLKDIVQSQELRIEQLEEQAKENKALVSQLQKDVDKLSKLTVQQALTIAQQSVTIQGLESELTKTRKGG
jgi:hypothetical protein